MNISKTKKLTQNYWRDLVNDYLQLWEIKEKLLTEIKIKGVMVKIKNGSQEFRKRSDAIVELPKISKRMTDILEIIGNAKVVDADDDGDPDL
ncbi:hypothetical protein [Listeria fleischmannii]|uniref:Phage terminase, small subunit n=1 Tax=Listeria fleischmannii FSL S10-1203 TaxID=1265822 RepID=W7DF01_9LIST|nr:hypothetical protein [Listeria fleischmannii]EUJ56427.1 phage terminase, small subunit [Listeria fleischmannii FSL S10-1203]